MFCSASFFSHSKGKVESFLSPFAVRRERESIVSCMISDNLNDYARILVLVRLVYFSQHHLVIFTDEFLRWFLEKGSIPHFTDQEQ